MSLLNNSSILNNPAFNVPLQVLRRTPGTRDDAGDFIPGTPSLIDISGSVQPVNEKEMQLLRENLEGGARITDAVRLYTQAELKVGTLGAAANLGDELVYDGLYWPVVRVPGNFKHHGHQKVYGVRADGQDG